MLVDDTPLAFLRQPDNGIPIFNFRRGMLPSIHGHLLHEGPSGAAMLKLSYKRWVLGGDRSRVQSEPCGTIEDASSGRCRKILC